MCPNATYSPSFMPLPDPFLPITPMTEMIEVQFGEALQEALSGVLSSPSHRALEIGGPTTYFDELYKWIDQAKGGNIDNVVRPLVDEYEIENFQRRGGVMVEGACAEGGEGGECEEGGMYPYEINGALLGKQYFAHGADLPFEDESYGFIMASHNLEHYPNPLKALLEWDRVLKPGGYMFLNLPDPRYTFDRRREVSDMSQLLKCYNAEAGLSKEDAFQYLVERKIQGSLSITAFEQTEGETDKEAEERCRAMVGNGRDDDSWADKFHWHVFDTVLME